MLWGWLEQCWCSRTAYEPKPLTDRTRCCKDLVQTIMSLSLLSCFQPWNLSSPPPWAPMILEQESGLWQKQLHSTVTRRDKEHTFGCSNCSYISVLYVLDAICLLASAWMQRSFDTVICSSLGRRGAREGPKKTIKSSEITAACHPNQQVWPESAKKGWKRERKVCRPVPLTHLQICNWTLACANLTAINPCRVSRLFWWHLQRHLLQTSRAEHPDNQACLTDSDGGLDRSNLSTQIESLQVYMYIWSGLHLSAKSFTHIYYYIIQVEWIKAGVSSKVRKVRMRWQIRDFPHFCSLNFRCFQSWLEGAV